jgi:hypothetical protein
MDRLRGPEQRRNFSSLRNRFRRVTARASKHFGCPSVRPVRDHRAFGTYRLNSPNELYRNYPAVRFVHAALAAQFLANGCGRVSNLVDRLF